MKTQIRKGAFETNSSSTHALNVFRGEQDKYQIPKEIHIRASEFGWECEKYKYPEDKLSYIYTWCLCKCKTWTKDEVTGKYEDHFDYKLLKDYQYRIKSMLESAGVEEVTFEPFEDSWYYIDHSDDLYENEIEDLLNNYFIDFVFNILSYIETGNDNSDYARVCEDSFADFSIYKGN